jgi:5'-nucleotidase
MEKPVLLLDMDEVVVDFTNAWIERFYHKTGISLNREDWKAWDLKNILPENVFEEFVATLREPGFFRNLPPMKGAIEGIRELNDYYDIVFLTASSQYAYNDKFHWIEENLSFVKKPNLILTHRKDLVIGEYLVDDAPHNLIHSPAKTKIVFDAPWNRDLKTFTRVYNWEQLISILKPDNSLFK